jgi:hypothetical protein
LHTLTVKAQKSGDCPTFAFVRLLLQPFPYFVQKNKRQETLAVYSKFRYQRLTSIIYSEQNTLKILRNSLGSLLKHSFCILFDTP